LRPVRIGIPVEGRGRITRDGRVVRITVELMQEPEAWLRYCR
jgi:hypothetical protein